MLNSSDKGDKLVLMLRDYQSKVRKLAKIRNRYIQATHLTQDTNGKVTTSQSDITNESQDVSPFPAGDQMASINRRARKHNENKTEIQCNINDPLTSGFIKLIHSQQCTTFLLLWNLKSFF